jgi:hypothetical protein
MDADSVVISSSSDDDIADFDSYVMLCVDPGTVNLAAGIFVVLSPDRIKLEGSLTKRVGRNAKNCHEFTDAAFEMMEAVAMRYMIPCYNRYACMESQQCGKQVDDTHVRNNTYVEACVTTRLVAKMDTRRIFVVTPSVVKRSLRLCTGNYGANKDMALVYAKNRCTDFASTGSHHVADCYCIAEYTNKQGLAYMMAKNSVAATSNIF